MRLTPPPSSSLPIPQPQYAHHVRIVPHLLPRPLLRPVLCGRHPEVDAVQMPPSATPPLRPRRLLRPTHSLRETPLSLQMIGLPRPPNTSPPVRPTPTTYPPMHRSATTLLPNRSLICEDLGERAAGTSCGRIRRACIEPVHRAAAQRALTVCVCGVTSNCSVPLKPPTPPRRSNPTECRVYNPGRTSTVRPTPHHLSPLVTDASSFASRPPAAANQNLTCLLADMSARPKRSKCGPGITMDKTFPRRRVSSIRLRTGVQIGLIPPRAWRESGSAEPKSLFW